MADTSHARTHAETSEAPRSAFLIAPRGCRLGCQSLYRAAVEDVCPQTSAAVGETTTSWPPVTSRFCADRVAELWE